MILRSRYIINNIEEKIKLHFINIPECREKFIINKIKELKLKLK